MYQFASRPLARAAFGLSMILGLHPRPAWTQEAAPPDAAAAVELDPQIVVASGSAQPAAQVLAAVSVLDRADIERAQGGDLAELLRFLPGVELGRNGGPGQVVSVFLRGAESNHTLVLIDGVRFNPATAGGAALQNLTPEAIERIEVLRGPRSTLYGSDAIGGVINIVTRKAEGQGLRSSGSLGGGSADTRRAAGRLAAADARAHASVDVQHEQTEGFPSCSGSDLDRGYRRQTVQASAGTTVGAAQWEASIVNAQGHTEYLDSCNATYGRNPREQDFANQLAQLKLEMQPLGAWDTRLSASRLEDRIDQRQANDQGQHDFVRTLRPGLDWNNELRLGAAGALSLGLVYAQEQVDALSYGSRIDDTRDISSLRAQQTWSSGAHSLLAALGRADYEGFAAADTWNLEYGYRWSPRTRWIAAGGTGFRAPDATDRYGFGGNPDLEPERSRSVELALQQDLGARQRLDLRLFENRVRDLISVEFDPANDPNQDFGYRAVNIDDARNRGLETSYSYRGPRWRLRGGVLLQEPRDEDSGDALLRRARRSANLSLVRAFGAHSLGLDALCSGSRSDVDADSGAPVRDGGYTLLNLTGGYALSPRWRLQVRIENLLDRDYETAAGYAQAGLSVFAGLRYSS